MELKQVIVARKDLNMRKGKLAAQVAHASVRVVVKYIKDSRVVSWLNNMQTKIVVSVDSEEELVHIYSEAVLAGLPCALIQDAGKTEFKEPTLTVVAVGPGSVDEVNAITGQLKLL